MPRIPRPSSRPSWSMRCPRRRGPANRATCRRASRSSRAPRRPPGRCSRQEEGRAPMARRAPTRSDHLRSAIAQEAARLMAEHGIQDYLVAKRKAAERYGVEEGSMLPKNTEVEAALMSYQRLFGGLQHQRSLQEQRRVAVEAMRVLEKFQPRLVG